MIRFHWPDQVLPKEIPYTNTIFLLGTGDDGPVNQPKIVTSPDHARRLFGTGGTLYRAYLQGYSKYPNLNYYLVKVTGSYAKALYYTLDEQTDNMLIALNLKSKGAAAKYNQIRIVLENFPDGDVDRWALVFYPPEEMGEPIAYYFDSFPTYGQLVQAINTDTDNGENFVYANTNAPLLRTDTILDANPLEQYLAGGDDGINVTKNEMYIALHTAYEVLEGRGIHVIVPLGVYFDDVYDPSYYGTAIYGRSGFTSGDDVLMLYDNQTQKRCTFHEQLIDFCRNQQKSGFITHGVIGLRPFSEDLINNMPNLGYMYTARLLEVTAFNDRLGLSDVAGTVVRDKGWYISIFCGDFLFNEGFENEYWDNGAVIYAGMIATSGTTGHTTNMPVPTDTTLNRDGTPKTPKYRPEYSSDELKLLARLGAVACRVSPKHGLVVYNGVTPALPDSELHDLANVKMVQYTLWFLNRYIKTFVGETIPRDWAVLHKKITDGIADILDILKRDGVILHGEYTLERTTSTWWKGGLRLAGKYTVQDIEVPMEVNLANGTA